jgi:hypothetical protein
MSFVKITLHLLHHLRKGPSLVLDNELEMNIHLPHPRKQIAFLEMHPNHLHNCYRNT